MMNQVILVSKKNKKEYIDDGHTIYNMDVDGMPNRMIKNESGIYLSKDERKAAIRGAFAHFLPILFISILSFSLVMILMLLWLK